MLSQEVQEYMREDFIDGLIWFSKGKITMEEANHLADTKFRASDFDEDSPIGHKGPRWLAMHIAIAKGYK